MDMLTNWPVDEVNPPLNIHSSLCYLNYRDVPQRELALQYRKAELPFIIYGVPEHERAVSKWTWDYLKEKIPTEQSVDVSDTNHMMFWRKSYKHPQGTPPTTRVRMNISEWLEKAVHDVPPGEPHYYFHVKSSTGTEEFNKSSFSFIESDMPIFSNTESLFIDNPRGQRGINCRFGMSGIISENHWDGGRNMVAMMKGSKRYILQPPSECLSVYHYPSNHPSYRHSKVNWSHPDLKEFPMFAQSRAHEVILREGEILYIPSFYLHFIVSLELNIQCNTRSGNPPRESSGLNCHFDGEKYTP
jgi:hypothetical protein